ncbi:MAG: DUF262 domain-containing protein [Burkholderiales bacterium]|nr:MAG: DUF262 domain-containing protein [Burkholderiales bacterium]
MKNFDGRVYSISDIVEWNSNGLLQLSPDFQRRAVWTEKAKSYLIDTILRGKPIPKVLITQDLQSGRTVRVVVDGQQRLRAILDYVEGAFKISRAHNREYAGMTFGRLPQKVQEGFLSYELGVDILFEMSYEELLDVFQRLNSYTVKLNKQELLNATYSGYFKQAAYGCGLRYVRYFVDSGILTKSSVTRMAEADLAADLLVSIVDGVQSNKGVERYYRDYEDDEGSLPGAVEKFDEIMSFVGVIYSADHIQSTNWSRSHLFYTLFNVVAHALYGVKGLNSENRFKLNKSNLSKVRLALDDFSVKYDAVAEIINEPKAPKEFKQFIEKSRRGTTDTGARVFRANFASRFVRDRLAK